MNFDDRFIEDESLPLNHWALDSAWLAIIGIVAAFCWFRHHVSRAGLFVWRQMPWTEVLALAGLLTWLRLVF